MTSICACNVKSHVISEKNDWNVIGEVNCSLVLCLFMLSSRCLVPISLSTVVLVYRDGNGT